MAKKAKPKESKQEPQEQAKPPVKRKKKDLEAKIARERRDGKSQTIESDYATYLNTRYGENTAVSAKSLQGDKPRIPLNIFAFDYASGGGLPIWGVSCFYGPESGGKTTAAFRAVASAQNTCFNCFEQLSLCKCKNRKEMSAFWVDLEGDLDLDWAEKHGVDPDRLVVGTFSSGEQALNAAKRATHIGNCGIVVVDSIADVVPSSELVDDALYSQEPATQARLIGPFVRQLRQELNTQKMQIRHPLAVLITNQVRMEIGVQFGSPETQSGGKALRHLYALWARFSQIAFENATKKETYTIDGKICASRHVVKFIKWKVPIFQQAAEFILVHDDIPSLGLMAGQIKDQNTLKTKAQEFGILTGGTGNYNLFDVEGIKNLDQLYELWRVRPEYYRQTQMAVIAARRSRKNATPALFPMQDASGDNSESSAGTS